MNISWCADKVLGASIVISEAFAGKNCGGFMVNGSLQVTTSQLHLKQAKAARSGGGFCVEEDTELHTSRLSVSEAQASSDGGGMNLRGKLHLHGSSVTIQSSGNVPEPREESDCSCSSTTQAPDAPAAAFRGGGLYAQAILAVDSEIFVSGLPEADLAVEGSGAFVQGPVQLVNSNLQFRELLGATALTSHCLELFGSALSLQGATDVGLSLQNSNCSCNKTLDVRVPHLN